MQHFKKLLHFVKPYWRRSVVALVFLVAVTLMDLSIPRLIQRMIDEGINGNNMQVVIGTTATMLVISLFQTLFALANNLFSIQVGESVARDLREALFLKIQRFSFGNLDHLNTGQLMVRLSSDTSAFQRMIQVFLRIGTRAPMLMIGSLILMFVTDARLAMTILPVLLATVGVIIFFVKIAELGAVIKAVTVQEPDQHGVFGPKSGQDGYLVSLCDEVSVCVVLCEVHQRAIPLISTL